MFVLIVAAIVLGLLLFDLAVMRWGAESRVGFGEQSPADYQPVSLFS